MNRQDAEECSINCRLQRPNLKLTQCKHWALVPVLGAINVLSRTFTELVTPVLPKPTLPTHWCLAVYPPTQVDIGKRRAHHWWAMRLPGISVASGGVWRGWKEGGGQRGVGMVDPCSTRSWTQCWWEISTQNLSKSVLTKQLVQTSEAPLSCLGLSWEKEMISYKL